MVDQVRFPPLNVVGRPWDEWRPPKDGLDTFTIFFSPKDEPGKWVTRRFESAGGEVIAKEGVVVGSLAEARALLPFGLMPRGRAPGDHPSVVETWI